MSDGIRERGRYYDIIVEALVDYDGWMLDDNYDATTVLNRIMKRMRERLEMSDPPDRAAKRIEALEKHKRLQTEDVMNLGAQLGQARLRIEQLEAALREIETICIESARDCRKRMGTRVGNTIVAARAALTHRSEIDG